MMLGAKCGWRFKKLYDQSVSFDSNLSISPHYSASFISSVRRFEGIFSLHWIQHDYNCKTMSIFRAGLLAALGYVRLMPSRPGQMTISVSRNVNSV